MLKDASSPSVCVESRRNLLLSVASCESVESVRFLALTFFSDSLSMDYQVLIYL